MLTVVQTNFNGIDGLAINTQSQPQLTSEGVLIKMSVLPVVPADWKRESEPNVTAEQLTQLPRTIGVGGVGQVVAVGANRDPQLLKQRVLVMHPAGAYAEYVVSTNPDWLLPLPASVSDQAAATLPAGAGTAVMLRQTINRCQPSEVIITGANSVIGLYLCQLLRGSQCRVWPVVTAASRSYFEQQLPEYQAVMLEELPASLKQPLVIDIAGYQPLLQELATKYPLSTMYSIVNQASEEIPALRFVHEEYSSATYQQLIAQLADGQLKGPIDRVFPVVEVKAAQHYAQDHHSRGRVLVTF
ncbi:hypothetical protein [Lactiplantibacillus herbarum]|uniref:hypothetical protein n=1 Tax=Lactiplantibacillus herbarum TaxID=1670446 RepID=UPI00064E9AC8|nr:hypothetical protein [Lactiplantibacillus herbarum]